MYKRFDAKPSETWLHPNRSLMFNAQWFSSPERMYTRRKIQISGILMPKNGKQKRAYWQETWEKALRSMNCVHNSCPSAQVLEEVVRSLCSAERRVQKCKLNAVVYAHCCRMNTEYGASLDGLGKKSFFVRFCLFQVFFFSFFSDGFLVSIFVSLCERAGARVRSRHRSRPLVVVA